MDTSLHLEATEVADEGSLSAPATLPDRSKKLLLLVIQHLDNEALLNLGHTCRQMNSIALNHFFVKNNIRFPGEPWFSPQINPLPPVETLAVLRSALFVQRLTFFNFTLNSGIARMRSEVSEIHVLATRLHTLEAFHLYFPWIDTIASHARECLPMGPWSRSLTGLLVTVLEKGCTTLHLDGGTRFSELYSNHISLQEHSEVGQKTSGVKMESRVIQLPMVSANPFRRLRFFRRKRRPDADGSDVNFPVNVVNTPMENSGETQAQTLNMAVDVGNSPDAAETRLLALPSRHNLGLTEVYLHSTLLLHHPFSQWTLLTLNAACSTLTKLSIILTVEASSTWKIFSSTLDLPLLQDFTFANELLTPSDIAAFADVEDFLAKHHRINHLYIYGVELPPSSRAAPRPKFQHLVTVDAHPLYIVWLMKSLVLDQDALPCLERVVISAEHHTRTSRKPAFDYMLFDSALEAIAAFPRNIFVTFTFNSEQPIEKWLSSHTLAGEKSIISRLVYVNTLSIRENWSEYTEEAMALIPDWLQLFPALKHLKFENEAEKNVAKLLEPQYLATISLLCPTLEKMEVNWHVFDLQLVRRDLGDGAG